MDPNPNLVLSGIVFDFQRFSTHDGHGIRSMVFLKGCPLSCDWCANPESQKREPQLGFYSDKCAACFACTKVCPNSAVFIKEGRVAWEDCKGCLECVDSCLYEARVAYGRTMTVEEVVKELLKDRVFFRSSGGGITLSGGEALYQPEFALNILLACKKEGVHTAVETCGFAAKEVFRKIAEHTDLLLYDLKHMDSLLHKERTGVPNEVILQNAVTGSEIVPEMIIRVPLIPDFNDDRENISQLGRFVSEKLPKVKQVDVLPYHSMGESKMNAIGGEYKYPMGRDIPEEKENEVRLILEGFGLTVNIGG